MKSLLSTSCVVFVLLAVEDFSVSATTNLPGAILGKQQVTDMNGAENEINKLNEHAATYTAEDFVGLFKYLT